MEADSGTILKLPADEFIRTTDERHHSTVQWMFKRCRENGFIEKGSYTGQYCVHDNAYVVDAGPGDPCPDCGRPTETVTEENYFFKLSEFQQKLLDFYAANPDFIKPESRRNEVLSFVQGGLSNLSITRTTIRWGIPVPGEAPHVFYVWFDALIGYLSAVGGPEYDRARPVARGFAYCRQGNYSFSRRLLAGIFDGGGFAVAASDLGARLAAV